MIPTHFLVGAVLIPLATAAAVPSTVESRENEVLGGEPAAVNDFPYMVSLSRQGSGHFCGGSLINERTVITAAHCVADQDASRITVRAGSVLTNSGGVTADAAQLITHPNYDLVNSYFDIAVVKLSQPIVAQGGISYVSLPATGFELAGGTRVKAAGWGATNTAGTEFSDILLMVELPVVDRSSCNESWGGNIGATMVCAGENLGGKDVCIGDSGGPLIVVGSSVLVGTVSYGRPCALPNSPTVYANVAYMRDFIVASM